jgi:hypothetical protein
MSQDKTPMDPIPQLICGRQIHLDFHTSPAIGDVGKDFDAEAFASQMFEARVNSVTLFAKCHHGLLYFKTNRPERHPGLKPGLDLLAEQVSALHGRGIRAPIYLSVQCDEYAADRHPEWVVVNPDGTRHAPPPFTRPDATWQILDMSSPYQDYLAEQLEEVVQKFKPVDGIFFDMCWNQPSASIWAQKAMRDLGLSPSDTGDRALYAQRIAEKYMSRFVHLIGNAHPGHDVPVFFNGRPWSNLGRDKAMQSHLEIESLPTGPWGYMFFPQFVRLVRPHQRAMLGMTGRFQKSWADFGGIKPMAALLYECTSMLAHGAGCSVGDQLHPRGTLDREAYETIGTVYSHVKSCEPYCRDPRFENEIGVIYAGQADYKHEPGGTYEGVVRLLQELRHQFDFIQPKECDLARYSVVIVPETVVVDSVLAEKLVAHLSRGGGLMVAGDSIVDCQGKPSLAELGISEVVDSPFSTTYFRYCDDPASTKTDYVMYEKGKCVLVEPGTRIIARVVEPYFERSWENFCSHFQTPPDKLTQYAAATLHGRAVSIAYPIFRAYASHGSLAYRELLRRCLQLLLPNPMLALTAPSHVEVTIYRQNDATIVHLLSFSPRRRTPTLDIVEDVSTCRNVKLSVRLAQAPRQVRLLPQNQPITCTYVDGRAELLLPMLEGHQMVAFE